ncbi:MAG: hypothetical protein MJ153_02685 [Clostridia bacterium]|nr:hypothetical protein [Clostridia bacterium]
MKIFKKTVLFTFTVAMVLSMTACGKSFKQIDEDKFEDGLKVLKLDDEMNEYDEDDYLDDDMTYKAYVYDDNKAYIYMEFEDEEAAKDYFEDNYYEDFEDYLLDEEFEGEESHKLKKDTGYILFNGEEEGDDVYGGIFLKGETIVVAEAGSTKKSAMKDINAFLDEIGYPKP